MSLPPATTPPPRTSASRGRRWEAVVPRPALLPGRWFPRSVTRRQRGLYSRERPPHGSRNTQSAFTLSGDFYFQPALKTAPPRCQAWAVPDEEPAGTLNLRRARPRLAPTLLPHSARGSPPAPSCILSAPRALSPWPVPWVPWVCWSRGPCHSTQEARGWGPILRPEAQVRGCVWRRLL